MRKSIRRPQMTKRGLAELTVGYRKFSKIVDASNERLMEILESAFSAIATANPRLALSILDQINAQRADLETAAKEREEDDEGMIQEIIKYAPESIELTDDEDEEDS